MNNLETSKQKQLTLLWLQLARPPEPVTIAQHVSYQMRTHFVPRWSFFPPTTAAEVRAAFTIISSESPADNPVGFLTPMFTAWAYITLTLS